MSVINTYYQKYAQKDYKTLLEDDYEDISGVFKLLHEAYNKDATPEDTPSTLFNIDGRKQATIEAIQTIEKHSKYVYVGNVDAYPTIAPQGKEKDLRYNMILTNNKHLQEDIATRFFSYGYRRKLVEIPYEQDGVFLDYDKAHQDIRKAILNEGNIEDADTEASIKFVDIKEKQNHTITPYTILVEVEIEPRSPENQIIIKDTLTKETYKEYPIGYNPTNQEEYNDSGNALYGEFNKAYFYHSEKGYLIKGAVKKLKQSYDVVDLIHGDSYYYSYGVANKNELQFNDEYNPAFIEEIYGLPRNTLNKEVSLTKYVKMLQYTGNLFQAFLQTRITCPWFLDNIMATMRNVATKNNPKNVKTLDEKNIQTWLDLSLPDYKYLLNQPTQDMMVHFMLANKHKPTSLTEFLKTHDKILELNKKWLSEFEKTSYSRTREFTTNNSVILKNKKNKYIMSSTTLPDYMRLYVDKSLHKYISLYRYLKYIIDEGKRSYNKEDGKHLTLQEIEHYLVDYNRMLKEINPKTTFVFPYKIKNAHDTMVVNYNDIMDERLLLEKDENSTTKHDYAAIYSKANPLCFQTDKHIVCVPHTTYDLHIEGSELNHCVGSYADNVLNGRTLIYFMRNRNNPKKPLLTIEVRKDSHQEKQFSVTQVRGKANRHATSEEQEFINQWIKEYNIDFKIKAHNRIEAAKKKRNEYYKNEIHYDKILVDVFKMYGFKEFTYDETETLEDNYVEIIKKGFTYIKDQKQQVDSDMNELKALVKTIKQVIKHNKIPTKPLKSILDIKPPMINSLER